ncbi:hypothetical protein J2S78_003222 [Salibacterium salarium]|uniref:hypothetical protein n=1 Tax=Salibacterium salarium TaxID=284579 RepID=UPI002785B1F2|nr:hypothetical protein [Salibacterium salarium]MDQ0300754.1 hypothetical protein [Salibacterium salarium]
MANILKILTSIWFIILMIQTLVSFGQNIVVIPDYLLITCLFLFAAVMVREFKKGIIRELEKDSSGR